MEILSGIELAARLQVSERSVARMTKANQIPHIRVSDRIIRYNLTDVLAALHVAHHTDDDAVNNFANAMRQRMTDKRAEGKAGWEQRDTDELGLQLLRSIADGDPIDIGNYAMMLHDRQADTTHVLEQVQKVIWEQRSPMRMVKVELIDAVHALLDEWTARGSAALPAVINRLAKAIGR